MAYIADDKVHCEECGCDTFVERKEVVINKDLLKNDTMKNVIDQVGISDRFLLSKKVSYVCAHCGAKLNC